VTDDPTASGPAAAAGEELVRRLEGGVLTLVLNRPDRRNAMTWSMVRAMRQAVRAARDDPAVRVVVLTGAGQEAFCAGADLGTMGEGDVGFLERHDSRGELAGLFEDLWGLGKPTVARVQGWAVAGGFGLALACDLVVAASSARFGATEVRVGLWPYMVTVPMLRSMGPKAALDLMLTGRIVGAEEGLRLGFVSRLVPDEALDQEVATLAAELASRSPVVTRLGRDAFYAVLDMGSREALAYLHALLTLTNQTEDAVEGIAAFHAKRPPQWRGR
jgi:enoyl-CoA hydratase/carnithine racemase